jgi:hypothetical protein
VGGEFVDWREGFTTKGTKVHKKYERRNTKKQEKQNETRVEIYPISTGAGDGQGQPPTGVLSGGDPHPTRRIGAYMTQYPLIQSRSMGYKIGVLQSSEIGLSVYRSLRFQEYCKIDSNYWQPEILGVG